MSVIEPQTHEVRGNMLFDQYGDRPYWQLRNIFSHEINGGCERVPVEVEGEQWDISLSYQESGLDPRPEDDADQLYEYRMNAYGDGERKIPILIQPRLDWDDDDRGAKSIPDDLGEAINVRIETAVNIEPREIRRLFPLLLQAIFEKLGADWSEKYFGGDLHQYSNISQWELYVRIQRNMARKIIKPDGIMWRIFHLLADLEGSKFVYSNDNTEIVGYNHQLRLDRTAASEMLQGRQYGKQIKHYHPQHVRDDGNADDDPLYHPKFGVAYKAKWNNGNSVRWSKRGELREELHSNLVNILEWADVPTEPGHWFVEDDHFAAEASDDTVTLYDDPTPAIEAKQESIVAKQLMSIADNDRDKAVIEEVALADGGEKHVSELEETAGSQSTLYRVLNRLDGLLENDHGNVQYASRKAREHVKEVLETMQDTIEPKLQILEDQIDVDPRDLERKGRAWANWCQRYAADIDMDGGPNGRPKIRVRELMSMRKSQNCDYAPEIIDYGETAWKMAGRNPKEFANAVVVFDSPDEGRLLRPVQTLLRKLR